MIGGRRWLGITVVGLALLPATLSAQGFFDEFSYEGLGFSGIGVEFGVIASDRVTTKPWGALKVDYGLIAPRVRVMFGASYFRGNLEDDEVRKFESQLAGVVDDPTGDFRIDVGTISWTNVEATVDLQYLFQNGSRFTTFIGVGLGVHVRSGSGDAIDGTFVEDALDMIAAGLNVSLGADVALTRVLYFTTDLRGGLSSELRTVSARGGFMFRFPRGSDG